MTNRIALITGATSGIGYVTALELSKMGFDLILVARNKDNFAFFDIDKLIDPSWYQDLVVYGRSKLANILFSNALADRLEPFGITSNCAHPGTVASNFAGDGTGASAFFMKLFRPFFRTIEQGAETTIYLATSPEVEGISGKYFVNSKVRRTSAASKDKKLGELLWELSEKYC